MKIGNLYITWRTSRKRLDDQAAVLSFLAHHPEARAITAKMARSEVKNYLADLAEQAEVPFGDPAGFLRAIRLTVSDATGTRECEQDFTTEAGS